MDIKEFFGNLRIYFNKPGIYIDVTLENSSRLKRLKILGLSQKLRGFLKG